MSNLKDCKFVTHDGRHYILCNDSTNELWMADIGGEIKIGKFDELISEDFSWIKNIFIMPEDIGFVYEGKVDGLLKFVELNDRHLELIKQNDGNCHIEVEITQTQGGEIISQKPVLIYNKVIIHI